MSGTKGNDLFKDFPVVSIEEWEEKIIQDLKGVDYEKKLVWKSPEGISVKPYYRSEHLEQLGYLNSHPGEFPYTRGFSKYGNKWDIREDILVKQPDEANHKALRVLEKGATALGFIVKKGSVKTPDDLEKLLDGIELEKTCINFLSGTETPKIISLFAEITKKRRINPGKITGSANYDPIGYLTNNGKYITNREQDINDAAGLIEKYSKKFPFFRLICVNGIDFCNAGASAVMELAFSLATGNEYLSIFTGMGLPVDLVAQNIQFNLGSGSNYFMEIAKLRAARMLWARIVQAWEPKSEDSLKTYIHSETSDFNKTVYDPYVNMLRITTEAMASAIGGTNSLYVKPFDRNFKDSSDFSERIARNTQIILKNEAYFDKVTDPSAGSYYIESLTDSLVSETWKLFQQIEKAGGYIVALENGFIQEQIEELCRKRSMNLALRKEVLVGTNQYVNTRESAIENVKVEEGNGSNKLPDNLVAKPLKKFRVAEVFEELRMNTEKYKGKTPEVFLFTYGDKKMRKARTAFATNLFAIAGFIIVDNIGFETAEEGLNAVKKKNPEMVVLCSSDEEYPEIADTIYQSLSGKTILVIAGYPKKSIDNLKETGYKHFIHIKTDVLDVLRNFQQELKIV
ncbi:MAG: acyl-CoA mutase large subunit family protein [Bacteroidetes bacterium]|nr:acyl-CoA mutase large subunit family protein [Bacteroidota bacterium]